MFISVIYKFLYYCLQKFLHGVYHCLEENYLWTILQNFFQIQNTLTHTRSNPNWYIIKVLNIRIKTNIASHFDSSQDLIIYLKAWRFSLDLTWKGNVFQTLGPCMRRLLLPKETWLHFEISKFSLHCSLCALLVLRTLNKNFSWILNS